MIKFLVPTDFSKNASNALKYAVELVSQVNGKLLLVHVVNLMIIPVRSGKMVSLTEKTDMYYYSKLNKLADKLRAQKKIACEVAVIDQTKHGSFQEGLHNFITDHQVDYVIMGTKGATNFLDKVVGTNTSEFIKVTSRPVLVVPAEVPFSGLKHIAFAANWVEDKSVYLKQLLAFTQIFPNPVLVSVINTNSHLDPGELTARIEDFFKNFPRINYSLAHLPDTDVLGQLHTFVQKQQVDALAVSVPKQDFFESIFQSHLGKELVYQPTLPLLALPELENTNTF